ncbi:MAG: sugar phosphate isomerase/epimerase [Clostridia bacterium]|nr:sugar phosphate isomerase/epimerase [Clostridia bacterium]
MKLCLTSSVVAPYLRDGEDPRAVFRAFRETGFRCVDFEIRSGYLGEDLEEQAAFWKDLMQELDLTVTQSHAPMPNPLQDAGALEPALDCMRKSIRFCALAGFPNLVIHPGARNGNTRDEFFERNVAFYQALIPTAEEYGVTVLIENIGQYMDPYFLWSGKDLLEMVERVGHPLFRACWDIGHANHFEYLHVGGTPYENITALGDKLVAIHAHENVGFFPDPNPTKRMDMHMMPYSSYYSSVNWDAVLQGLKDVGYTGTFNFESTTPSPQTGRPEFRYGGQVVRTLEKVPLQVWKSVTASLYEIGRFMLESYGLYEE